MKLQNWRLFFSICIGIVLALPGLSLAEDIAWQQDISRAKQLAVKENKLVLLHFTAEWCRPCKNLERFVFTSPIVQQAVHTNTIPVAVDVDMHPELVKKFAVASVPTDVVITPNGRIVTRRISPKTVDGYARMLNALDSTIHDLENGRPSIAQDLAELQHKLRPKTKEIAENNQFAPNMPSHSAPKLPMHGSRMTRANPKMFGNPFVESTSKAKTDSEPNGIATKSTNAVTDGTNDFAGTKLISKTKRMPLEPVVIKNHMFDVAPESTPDSSSIAKSEMNGPQHYDFASPFKSQPKEIASPSLESAVAEKSPLRKQETAIAMRPQATIIREDRSAFALNGKCPVTLMLDSKWVDGNQELGCVHRGQTYLFSNKEHLAKFQQDPDKFSPMLAGYDPVIFRDQGQLVEGREEFGVFMGALPDQRIILFSSKQTQEKFRNHAADYINNVRQAMQTTDGRQDTKLR